MVVGTPVRHTVEEYLAWEETNLNYSSFQQLPRCRNRANVVFPCRPQRIH